MTSYWVSRTHKEHMMRFIAIPWRFLIEIRSPRSLNTQFQLTQEHNFSISLALKSSYTRTMSQVYLLPSIPHLRIRWKILSRAREVGSPAIPFTAGAEKTNQPCICITFWIDIDKTLIMFKTYYKTVRQGGSGMQQYIIMKTFFNLVTLTFDLRPWPTIPT